MAKKRPRRKPPPFRLAALLRKRRMTKQELAEKAKMPLSMVYRLCAPGANPSWEVILRLCRALGCSPSEFRDWRKP